jgi:hypothetical protein
MGDSGQAGEVHGCQQGREDEYAGELGHGGLPIDQLTL